MRAKILHIVLLVAGIALPIIAAFQDAADELGKLGKAGIIAAGVISAITTVSHVWKPALNSLAKRIFAIIGTAAGIASPILAAIYTTMPTTAKSYLFMGTASALVGSLKTAFGASGVQPADLLDIGEQKPADVPPGGGEKSGGQNQ